MATLQSRLTDLINALGLDIKILRGSSSITATGTITAGSNVRLVAITAQNIALNIANPTGSPVDGQALIFRIKDNGTARAITYGTNFRALGVTLPTTTVISKTLYIGCIFNAADTKWDVVAVGQEA